MQRRGKVTSLPVSAPPSWPRIWVDSDDPRAPFMLAAQSRQIVDGSGLFRVLPRREIGGAEVGLNELGIVAVPVGAGRFRLVGTRPEIAWIANRYLWGCRRRFITREALIERVFGLQPGPRKTSVTQKRLEKALFLLEEEFGIDLCDLIDHPAVGIGRTTGPTNPW